MPHLKRIDLLLSRLERLANMMRRMKRMNPATALAVAGVAVVNDGHARHRHQLEPLL
jgi:hypothetical protein